MREITKRPAAKRDLIRAAAYLGEQAGMRMSVRFLQAAEAAFETLALMPGMGVSREYSNPECAGMRMWPVPRFRRHLIFYLVTDEAIEIVRVLHGSQNINGIFQPDEDDR